MTDKASYRDSIMRVLENSRFPMDIENVRLAARMKNWESAKSILLEMALQGSIKVKRTTKSWIFWVDGTSNGN
jgi:hypothetical protein